MTDRSSLPLPGSRDARPSLDRDPCQGCRHLRTYSCPCQRPTCARQAHYGDARCRREPAPPRPHSDHAPS